MKKSLLFFFVLIGTFELDAQIGDEDHILGVWKSPNNSVMIKVDKMGNYYQGRIVWLQSADNVQPVLDTNNPEERLRKMPLKGNKVIQELSFDPSSFAWEGGTFYHHEEGKLYNCHIVLHDKDQLKITRFVNNRSEGIAEIWVRH